MPKLLVRTLMTSSSPSVTQAEPKESLVAAGSLAGSVNCNLCLSPLGKNGDIFHQSFLFVQTVSTAVFRFIPLVFLNFPLFKPLVGLLPHFVAGFWFGVV
jgi:hypothetical protein